MLIYIVRHGETKANVEGYFQGWTDGPLTENGRRLAVVTGRGLISRCGYFLKELIARDDDKTYLIATHGVALRAMRNFLYDDPEDFWHGHIPYNCAVNIVEAKGGIAKLIVDDRIYYSQEDVMKTPLPCGAVAPMEVVSFGGHKTLMYF